SARGGDYVSPGLIDIQTGERRQTIHVCGLGPYSAEVEATRVACHGQRDAHTLDRRATVPGCFHYGLRTQRANRATGRRLAFCGTREAQVYAACVNNAERADRA